MPIHDWSQVEAGIFHDFHQAWTIAIRDALNAGGLPPAYFAMVEAPPQARSVRSVEPDRYVDKANRIGIKRTLRWGVAVLEIVSPGNKSSLHARRSFVEKSAQLLREGINLLIVDLFPPSACDPQGLHKAIWDEIHGEPFELPLDKPLTVAAYSAMDAYAAYVQPVAVGDPLPNLPIFLEPGRYVAAPLETTYQSTWAKCPDPIKQVIEMREVKDSE